MSRGVFDKPALIRLRVDRSASKHSGVIALFDKEFVKQNIVSKELGRMLHQAFESRQEGDYHDISKIDRRKATEILESADEFVRAIEEKLRDKQP